MKELAQHNRNGHDSTYETIWDSEKIYGCQCDHGYTGPDCSLG